jgi:hypothetical protein
MGLPPHDDTDEFLVTSGKALSESDFELIKRFEKWLFLYGEGSYRGERGNHLISICMFYYYDPSTGSGDWTICNVLPKISPR